MRQGTTKNDREAINHFGREAYAAIPKSAFAVLAWHLANVSSASCDADGAAEARMIEEADALNANGILSDAHFKAVKKALAADARRFEGEGAE